MSECEVDFRTQLDESHDDLPVACNNCEWEGRFQDVNPIKSIGDRISPGEIVPAGECPKCGCLAHLTTDKVTFSLVDQADPKAPPVAGSIKVDANGIYIAIDGHGECEAADGAGTPVGLELYEGKVRVLVWDDINDADPTITEMDGAKESNRKEEGDDLCDLCMTSGVNATRATPCGKTIGVECGCDKDNKDGKCGDTNCEDCHPPATAPRGRKK